MGCRRCSHAEGNQDPADFHTPLFESAGLGCIDTETDRRVLMRWSLRFTPSVRADLAMRGCAISFWMRESAAAADICLRFLLDIHSSILGRPTAVWPKRHRLEGFRGTGHGSLWRLPMLSKYREVIQPCRSPADFRHSGRRAMRGSGATSRGGRY